MTRDGASKELIGGRFRLQRRLARGGNGEVFVALDESTGEQVALKRLLSKNNEKSRTANFMREYHGLSGLRHPRIIEVYHYGVDGGAPYYTMELLTGHDLNELSPLPYREACSYLRDVALSLALLHARRLLHRDVSPRNVRRAHDGRCKLIDFGAMIPFGTPASILGTPPCLAPETLHGGPLDQTSDLYSLGACLYFALTGRHAYPARELSALPALWRQGVPPMASDIPQALQTLVLSLLNPDPGQRPASAAEVIDRLVAIAELDQEDDRAIGRSCLASTPLLGRQRERALLVEGLQKAKGQAGAAFWIVGEAGSGKTRMLTEAGLIAQTCGLAVVRVVLREQRGLSSTLIRDLIAGLMQVAPLATAELTQLSAASRDRAELLRRVERHVCTVAGQQPLLLTFDDVQYASDQDAALIAALAHRTSEHPLCVIASETSQKKGERLAQLADLATLIALKPLQRAQVAMLSAALFGDVPNVHYISDLFYRNAQGNPKLTLELAECLLARGTLVYAAGNWVVPEEITEPLPHDIAQTLLLRMESIGADARALVDTLCVRRRGARVEQLLELAAPMPADRVFRAVEELVGAGVLESAGDEYAFIQEALRLELSRALAPAVRQELHLQWANFLLCHAPTQDDRLEAGWNLTHTRQELRGAELLAAVAPKLVERRVSMNMAVPALERALEVYERHDKSLSTRLYLRSLLVMSSFLYDYRLAGRHGEATLDLLYPYTGLPEAETCSRWFGRRTAFLLGATWALLRWLVRPSATRGPHVIAALKYYAISTIGLMGLRAVQLGNTQAVLERMQPFEHAPVPLLSVSYMLARAIHLHGLGRCADAYRSIAQARSLLSRKSLWQVSQHEHVDLRIGLLLLDGINETWRERSRAIECADELDSIGTPLAMASSMRVRMTFYALRGDSKQAQHYRRLLELKAIENGSLWQVQWLAIPLDGLAAGTWHDVVGMRRALERLQQLVQDVPALASMRQAIAVPYYFRRNAFQAAVDIGEEYIRKFPPMTRIGWPLAYAFTALAHAHLGQVQRALAICEDAFAHVTPDDRAYFVFYAPLEAAYASALALTGKTEQSAEVFRTRLERLQAIGDHMRIILMHHYRAALARLLGDASALQQALADMRDTANQSGNPDALALAQRLSEEPRPYSDAPLAGQDWLDEIPANSATEPLQQRSKP